MSLIQLLKINKMKMSKLENRLKFKKIITKIKFNRINKRCNSLNCSLMQKGKHYKHK